MSIAEPLNYLVDLVFRFNREVVKIGDRPLYPLPLSETRWLRGALEEEAGELEEALEPPIRLGGSGSPVVDPEVAREALVAQVDACGDAVIFALGGLARLGLTEEQATRCLLAIMAANFEKKAGVKPGREGAADAIKPEGWVGPEARIRQILFGGDQ